MLQFKWNDWITSLTFCLEQGRAGALISEFGFGLNVGVIAQEYKTTTRLFLCKNALVEDSGQNPHRAIKIDPTKFKSVLGRTFAAP